MLLEKEQKFKKLKIARILLFVVGIAAVLLLFYLSAIGAISNNAYLISGFGIVVTIAIINYTFIRVYGNKPPR
ncbi:MAG: hypothetical protein LBH74_03155 [Nitrososphaerota archaeon]|jgi:hypothetical protein|nr:hypothetical protein [Nitrososphaerota archaeon]